MERQDASFEEFLCAIGAKSPTPGGGAVTGAVGAIASALGAMVVNYSIGKKSLAKHADDLESALAALEKARAVLMILADEDEQAYALVNELTKLPPGNERRMKELPVAAEAAVRIPLSVIATLCDVLRMLEDLCEKSNRHLRSDLAIAAILAESAARASRWNVAINMPLLNECSIEEDYLTHADIMLTDAAPRLKKIESACAAD